MLTSWSKSNKLILSKPTSLPRRSLLKGEFQAPQWPSTNSSTGTKSEEKKKLIKQLNCFLNSETLICQPFWKRQWRWETVSCRSGDLCIQSQTWPRTFLKITTNPWWTTTSRSDSMTRSPHTKNSKSTIKRKRNHRLFSDCQYRMILILKISNSNLLLINYRTKINKLYAIT